MCFSLQNNSLFKSEGKFLIFFIADSYELGDFKQFLHVLSYTLAGALIAGKYLPARTFSLEYIPARDILAHPCPFLASSPINI